VCVRVCVRVCVCVCVCVCVSACVCVCVLCVLCTHTHVCVCACVCQRERVPVVLWFPALLRSWAATCARAQYCHPRLCCWRQIFSEFSCILILYTKLIGAHSWEFHIISQKSVLWVHKICRLLPLQSQLPTFFFNFPRCHLVSSSLCTCSSFLFSHFNLPRLRCWRHIFFSINISHLWLLRHKFFNVSDLYLLLYTTFSMVIWILRHQIYGYKTRMLYTKLSFSMVTSCTTLYTKYSQSNRKVKTK